jgi:hypothetical protein
VKTIDHTWNSEQKIFLRVFFDLILDSVFLSQQQQQQVLIIVGTINVGNKTMRKF